MLILQRFQTADAAADDDAAAVGIGDVGEPGVLDGHLRRSHRELRVAVGAAHVLGVFEKLHRLEIFHLAGDLAVVAADVEKRHATDAADAVREAVPEG